MEKKEFKCVLCKEQGAPVQTGKKPRDRKDLDIVDCPCCGHRQLFPLLGREELKEEYDADILGTTCHNCAYIAILFPFYSVLSDFLEHSSPRLYFRNSSNSPAHLLCRA